MKWIVLSIVICLTLYTWLTLHYRKAQPSFMPYQDMKNQANVIRLLAHNYQRVTLAAERLPTAAVTVEGSAKPAKLNPGYPQTLTEALAAPPTLPEDYSAVVTPASIQADQNLPVKFTCHVADDHHVVGQVELYLKDDLMFFIPVLESVGGLSTRKRESSVQIIIPAKRIPPGTYQAALLGSAGSIGWTLQVH